MKKSKENYSAILSAQEKSFISATRKTDNLRSMQKSLTHMYKQLQERHDELAQ
jgi:hypothetical protein